MGVAEGWRMKYSIEVHKHRFAAWAAARAASVNHCRFKVEDGKKLLEEAGFTPSLSSPCDLPTPQSFDTAHAKWRAVVIDAAAKRKLPCFTDGVAAKLINVYLKSRFVCGGHHEHAQVKAIHPPIDSVLLDKLCSENFGNLGCKWQVARRIRWSKFNSDQYQEVIQDIRAALKGAALWEIERYWRGYQ